LELVREKKVGTCKSQAKERELELEENGCIDGFIIGQAAHLLKHLCQI